MYGTVCKAKNAGISSLQQLKQAADEVAGGFENHESGHKSRGWDALAPHRRQGCRGILSCTARIIYMVSDVYDLWT
jgi:hypothetical protein